MRRGVESELREYLTINRRPLAIFYILHGLQTETLSGDKSTPHVAQGRTQPGRQSRRSRTGPNVENARTGLSSK